MKFRTPGRLESYFRGEEEGFRNPNDREGGFSDSGYAEQIKELPVNIDVRCDYPELTKEDERHLELLQSFCNEFNFYYSIRP